MSFKSSIVKTAIKLTPNAVIVWAANIVLKGIVELSEFQFDLDARTAYVQMQLYGEEGLIEVRAEGFAVFNEEGTYKFILQQGRSNRPWMDNMLNRIAGKAWKIPMIGPIKAQIGLINELLPLQPTQEGEVESQVE